MNSNPSNSKQKAGFCAAGQPPWAQMPEKQPQTARNEPPVDRINWQFAVWLAHTPVEQPVSADFAKDFH